MSPQDKANFSKGGPMPPGAAKKLAQQQAALKSKEPASFKAWEAQRNAALAKQGASSGNPPPKPAP